MGRFPESSGSLQALIRAEHARMAVLRVELQSIVNKCVNVNASVEAQLVAVARVQCESAMDCLSVAMMMLSE